MSGRGAGGAVLAEWSKGLCRPVHLLEVDFNPYIYLTDAGTNLTWNGNAYLASQFLGFSAISETADLLVNSVTVSLSGVDQAVIAILLQETYLHRKLKIRTAMLDASLSIIADPTLRFEGRIKSATIAVEPDSGTVTCAVDASSHWADFEARNGRHSNHAEQQRLFPEDMGFRQVSTLDREVYWGIWQNIESGAPPRRARRTKTGGLF